MIKTLTNLLKQDKEKFVVPKGVQDCIPITAIYDDGIFRVGKDKYSKSFKFTDINFAVASREDKEAMFLEYSELLNSLDSGATTKLTINNRRLNRLDFEKTILIPETGDELDVYREEYNKMLLDKATGANAIVQDKYVTISINKKSVEDARTYFARVGADLIAHFARLGSKCVELETDERLRIVHDFFRVGEETAYHFNIKETRKKGHDFKDYVCPDTMEFEKDYFKMGNRYGRVLFLREYASYIKDSMVAELTDLNRNLMLGFVKEAFLMEKERQELLDLHCEATVDGYTDFIFINRFGQPQHQATLNKAIRRIIRDCNDEQLLKDENAEVLLPHFSCHSLRHTFTTRMCEAGVNVKVIQDTLGHKDISTTLNIYTDVTKELRKSEFEGLDSYFKNEYNKVSV